MYHYDGFDKTFVLERAAQFRDQVARRLSGALTEEQFKPLRLQNGLYLQLHAYMLRIAIPYGVLSARQLRGIARIARKWDRGYGHFTTRQNIQFNWIRLEDAPDILDALAEIDMHAIQTSGNCIRNVTADPYAGVAIDEIEDPRIWAEVLRQWSTLHQEFTFLPRKFKIAISGAANDRAALMFHDIGLKIVRNSEGATGFRVYVGGGQGRTPYVAKELAAFVPRDEILSYLEATMRAYNLHGRRDNIHKARIKILVNELGIDGFRAEVEKIWKTIDKASINLPARELDRIVRQFRPAALPARALFNAKLEERRHADPEFSRWMRLNILPHRVPGYAIVNVSLKQPGQVPGDATAGQMEVVAGLAERFGHDEIRVTYQQNLVLPTVALGDLPAVYDELCRDELATANSELVTDIIACPGLDFCSLANARSINIAQEIGRRFASIERAEAIGPLRLNISGCINACGHHHAGHIGILGVDKKGTEHYQITLGGCPADDAAIGEIVGPSFSAHAVPGAIEKIIATYLALRRDRTEPFIATYRRLGKSPFRHALYRADAPDTAEKHRDVAHV